MASDSHPTTDDRSIDFKFYATGFDAGKHHLVDPTVAQATAPGGMVTTLCSFEKQGAVLVDSPEAIYTLLMNFCGHCRNSAALPDDAIDQLEALAVQYDPSVDTDSESEPLEETRRFTADAFDGMDHAELRAIAKHTEVNGNSSTEDLRASLSAIAPVIIEDK